MSICFFLAQPLLKATEGEFRRSWKGRNIRKYVFEKRAYFEVEGIMHPVLLFRVFIYLSAICAVPTLPNICHPGTSLIHIWFWRYRHKWSTKAFKARWTWARRCSHSYRQDVQRCNLHSNFYYFSSWLRYFKEFMLSINLCLTFLVLASHTQCVYKSEEKINLEDRQTHMESI